MIIAVYLSDDPNGYVGVKAHRYIIEDEWLILQDIAINKHGGRDLIDVARFRLDKIKGFVDVLYMAVPNPLLSGKKNDGN